MASLILVRNVVGELRPKRTLAASRGFLAAARLSCFIFLLYLTFTHFISISMCICCTLRMSTTLLNEYGMVYFTFQSHVS